MTNDVIFNKGQGGLGRPLAGTDYVSGLLFYSASLPSGFASNDRIKTIFSVEEAEDLGILDSHVGETKATGTITVTGAGAQNDTIKVDVVTDIATVTLGTATVPSTPTTTTVAAAIVTVINAGTSTHGFTASNASAVVTVTAPSGSGAGANTWTFSLTIVGTATATNVSFASGVASDIDILHYHVSEFFRIQPKGKLYVSVQALADVGTWAKITELQNFALGEIKQLGIYQKSTAFATSQVTAIQAVVTALEALHKPLQVIYQADFSAVSDLSTLSNLKALSAKNVSVTIGQDGANVGYQLWRATTKSIGVLGTCLGAVALAKVNESIAWVSKFNLASDELDTLAFVNGDFYIDLSDGLIANIDTLGYIYAKKYIGLVGSWFNRPHTAIALTSDYTYIYSNRTIDKAIRGLRAALLPQLASPVQVNADGTLTEDVIGFYESLCSRSLEVMQRDAELSAFQVIIDPSQDVLSDNELTIAVKLVPVGVADTITVNIGFTLNL